MKNSLILFLFLTFFCCVRLYAQNTFPWANTGNVGIGTTTPLFKLHVTDSANGLPGLFQRITTASNQFGSTILAKATSTVDMVNGFGPAIGFQIRDNAGVDNAIGVVGAVRSGADNSGSLVFHTYNAGSSGEKMRITNSGNVGIGNTNPSYPLDISKNSNDAIPCLNLRNSNAGTSTQTAINFFNNAGTTFATHGAMVSYTASTTQVANTLQLWNFMNGDIRLGTNSTERMRIAANGNVGIGTNNISDINYKLYVEGSIRTRKVKVDIDTWADYVFNPSYKLPSLTEVAAYIRKHQHLPDVPSAAEVQKSGLDLGNNQVLLLKKIEELTLYVIEQNNKILQQQEQLDKQEKRIKLVEKK